MKFKQWIKTNGNKNVPILYNHCIMKFKHWIKTNGNKNVPILYNHCIMKFKQWIKTNGNKMYLSYTTTAFWGLSNE